MNHPTTPPGAVASSFVHLDPRATDEEAEARMATGGTNDMPDAPSPGTLLSVTRLQPDGTIAQTHERVEARGERRALTAAEWRMRSLVARAQRTRRHRHVARPAVTRRAPRRRTVRAGRGARTTRGPSAGGGDASGSSGDGDPARLSLAGGGR